MPLQSRCHVKESVVLTRAHHLVIHNYIRSLQNIILIPILFVRHDLNTLPTTCVYDTLAT